MTLSGMSDCATCLGNGILDDGYPCPDCREWEDDEDYAGECIHGGPAPCIDDICHAVGGCMHWKDYQP
jgi:hypothetical protein